MTDAAARALFDWYPMTTLDKVTQVRADYVEAQLVDGRETELTVNRLWRADFRDDHGRRWAYLGGPLLEECAAANDGYHPWPPDAREDEIADRLNEAARRVAIARERNPA